MSARLRVSFDAFDEARPAATTVVIPALIDSGWKIEIEAEVEAPGMTQDAATPQLIVLSGPHKGDVIVLDDPLPVVFGKRTGVSLPDPDLDEVHCQVFRAGDRWFIQDFSTSSGTWLGDTRVEGVRPMELGRTFRIGDTHIAFVVPDEVGGETDAFLKAVEEALRTATEAAAAEGKSSPAPEQSPAKASRKRKRQLPSKTEVFDLETPAPVADLGVPTGSSEDLPSLAPHDTVGDYDIIEVLGVSEGVYATVYKGYDRRRRKVVAIKVLDTKLARDAPTVARFLRGAKAGGRLSHRHIVKVLAAGHAAGRIYVTMEFVDGLNLEQFCLASGGKLDPKAALGIASRITEALVYAHSRKVLHRNVGPRNVLIGPGGEPKLADFSLAKKTTGKSLTITHAGESLTRSVYTAPESVLGQSEMDERSDVYGVGATLFRTLTGRAPYGERTKELTKRILSGDLEDPRALVRGISDALVTLLERSLTASPDDRYPAMRNLREAMADVPEMG